MKSKQEVKKGESVFPDSKLPLGINKTFTMNLNKEGKEFEFPLQDKKVN